VLASICERVVQRAVHPGRRSSHRQGGSFVLCNIAQICSYTIRRDGGTGQMAGKSPVCDHPGESMLASICGCVVQRVVHPERGSSHRQGGSFVLCNIAQICSYTIKRAVSPCREMAEPTRWQASRLCATTREKACWRAYVGASCIQDAGPLTGREAALSCVTLLRSAHMQSGEPSLPAERWQNRPDGRQVACVRPSGRKRAGEHMWARRTACRASRTQVLSPAGRQLCLV
jgi:hypothetical protein